MQCVEHRNPVTGRQSPAYVIGELNGQGDYSTMDQAEEEKGFSFAPPRRAEVWSSKKWRSNILKKARQLESITIP